MRFSVGAAVALLWTFLSALADPVGTYDLSGTNPGNGTEYSGVVSVQRTGDTFLVVWTIAGSRQVGIGAGGGKSGGRACVLGDGSIQKAAALLVGGYSMK
jgi:hypothetical protein